MFDGLMQPTHLLVAFAMCAGLYGFVRLVRRAWKKG